jgi:hypothetical protein
MNHRANTELNTQLDSNIRELDQEELAHVAGGMSNLYEGGGGKDRFDPDALRDTIATAGL